VSEAPSGDHQSIGEVLALLKEDFPDVTISKIRFLESQGLIHPERTASGYRKFYDADIEQLRWILRQQRDNFLPLKVIKKMLEEGTDRLDPGTSPQPTLWTQSAEGGAEGDDDQTSDPPPPPRTTSSNPAETHGSEAAAPGSESAAASSRRHPTAVERRPGTVGAVGAVGAAGAGRSDGPNTTKSTADAEAKADMDTKATSGSDTSSTPEPATGATSAPAKPRHETPADVVAALQEAPKAGGRRSTAAGRSSRARASAGTSTDLTADELQAETGIGPELVAGLAQYGLIESWNRGGEEVYGSEALEVARLAVRYAELGVEPRHLRMYKVSAEREAGFVEQLAVPFLKQRNPAARTQAVDLAGELTQMGADLHAALLRRELGSELGG